jgi:hypothetical protein
VEYLEGPQTRDVSEIIRRKATMIGILAPMIGIALSANESDFLENPTLPALPLDAGVAIKVTGILSRDRYPPWRCVTERSHLFSPPKSFFESSCLLLDRKTATKKQTLGGGLGRPISNALASNASAVSSAAAAMNRVGTVKAAQCNAIMGHAIARTMTGVMIA